jgi:hypothetical protein
MTTNLKPGKIALVVFLTVLIWVWADLAQDDKVPLTGKVTIDVSSSTAPAAWIVFKKGEVSKPGPAEANATDPKNAVKKDEPGKPGPIRLDNVDLKGPAKKVADIRRMRDMGKLDLDLYLDPNQEGLQNEGSHVFDVLSYLRRNDQIRRMGLTVESCEPSKLTIDVQSLQKKPVTVECVDANNNSLGTAVIDPPRVQAWVPKDGVLTARIRLTADEQQRAKILPITKTPFVELAPNHPRDALETVRIKLPPRDSAQTDRTVQVTLGICFSQNLQGKYQVNLQNASDFANVVIQATPVAAEEFAKHQSFQLSLDIDDEDAQKSGVIEREVSFRFPPAYVQRGEIRESAPLPKAKFTLTPVSEVKPPKSAG